MARGQDADYCSCCMRTFIGFRCPGARGSAAVRGARAAAAAARCFVVPEKVHSYHSTPRCRAAHVRTTRGAVDGLLKTKYSFRWTGRAHVQHAKVNAPSVSCLLLIARKRRTQPTLPGRKVENGVGNRRRSPSATTSNTRRSRQSRSLGPSVAYTFPNAHGLRRTTLQAGGKNCADTRTTSGASRCASTDGQLL